jgi:benzoyl-CoA 2,3-dioxygenase component B
MQLAALAESGFDPLSRSCRFMLTEEAHHLFVGETGVGRTVEATCAAMNKAGITDPYDVEAIRKLGVVDLPLLQRKANFHMSVTRDLFGSEISSNGADAFNTGLKGRFNEAKLSGDDHQLQDATYDVTRVVDGKLVVESVPALRAINCRLLDDYIADCQGGIDRWNKAIAKAGIQFEITQPHKGFHRKIGEFAGQHISPAGEILSAEAFAAKKAGWLPNDADMDFIHSLMTAHHAPGQYASWIAPPRMGINQQPVDYEYVKID